MIIVPNNDKESEAATPPTKAPSDDPPPTYTPQSSGPAPPAVSQSASTSNAVKPSNFVSIRRKNGNMTCSWLIDPLLIIPASFLPPLEEGETEENRSNLRVRTSNGSMYLDITLVPHDPTARDIKGLRRTTLYTKTSNGCIKTKLHAPGSAPRLPFYFHAETSNGPVAIHLPRSFQGPLILKTSNGGHKFSPEVSAQLTIFSEVNGVCRCFVGEYSNLADEWRGDEVLIETSNGSIKISYDDEVEEKAKHSKKKGGFFERFFGLNN